ncbi:hypothetical protein LguiB_018639 [Lonicera macranthoides]
MALTPRFFLPLLLIITTLSLLQARPSTFHSRHTLKYCKFDKIYQLGDSISDTGNLIRENPFGPATPCAQLPYGETFFKNATGRCSDGLLMIDYIATAAGLPFLDAYKNNASDFSHGANFAVVGSTAQPVHVLAEKNISSPVTPSSLNVQLEWMFTHFDSICDTDCAKKFKRSLFMVGEIGGNDYNYALFQGKSVEEVEAMVPDVVQTIKDAAQKVIQKGAVRLVIPGNFPIGCQPIYLTGFETNNSEAYDRYHCLKRLNSFSKYHNRHLQQAIRELRQENPNVAIAYGDYYHAFHWLFRNVQHLGFDTESRQKACCGTGGNYNFNVVRMCGDLQVPACANPDRYLSWDGIHLTHKAYKMMAKYLISDISRQFRCFV